MTSTLSGTGITSIAPGTYQLDPAHSSLGFVARHAMVTKVRGAFTEFDGEATVGANLADSSARVTIKSASITTNNAQRDGHLHSNDFFDVETHPEITFLSTSVEPTADGVSVTGELTIKGVTKPVTVPFEFTGAATDPFGNQRIGFEGSVAINRKDWGVNWNAALEAGGVLVSEKVTLTFDVSAIKTA